MRADAPDSLPRSVMRRIAFVLALAAASCSDASLPVQPSPSVASASSNPALPIRSFVVSGSVRDTFFNGLPDVPVEIHWRPFLKVPQC